MSLGAGPAAGAIVAGLLADGILGEPPSRWHPVAAYGRLMEGFERRLWSDRRRAGVVYALGGTALAATAGVLLDRGRPARRCLVRVLAVYSVVAARALRDAGDRVASDIESGDLDAGRKSVRALVGRRTDGLDEAELARAAVESLAENTVDAVVAPVFWAALGGPAAALAYRAVNTLDAMVGHHSPRYERFGWAAARADDLANWIPARLTAIAVTMVRPDRARAVLRCVRRQAGDHPSPNAGVAEASFAAALGIRLGGWNEYGDRRERRPDLGEGRPVAPDDIGPACRLCRDVTWATAALTTAALVGLGRVPALREPVPTRRRP